MLIYMSLKADKFIDIYEFACHSIIAHVMFYKLCVSFWSKSWKNMFYSYI